MKEKHASAINHIEPFTYHQAKAYWQTMLEQTPLIHCLTNPVALNFSANMLLASGASPAMVAASQEVAAFTTVAANLLINVGILHDGMIESMCIAAEVARRQAKPWVLDPVAVGHVLRYRSEFVQELMTYSPAVIRGNAAEILF